VITTSDKRDSGEKRRDLDAREFLGNDGRALECQDKQRMNQNFNGTSSTNLNWKIKAMKSPRGNKIAQRDLDEKRPK
jgi:hypothetical protein